MTHRIADRVKETASTSGTGSFTLAGAVSGFVTFDSHLTSNGDTCWYSAVNGSEWEVGLGTRSSAGVLARTTVLASSNSGSLVNFSVAPTVFLTVPASALVMAAAPAVSAYRATSNQSATSGSWVKVQLNGELADTAGAFDSTTNYRFTPQVAGYYLFEFAVYFTAASALTQVCAGLYKNGSLAAQGTYTPPATTTTGLSVGGKMIYLNGSTDYVELFGYCTGTTPVFAFGDYTTFLTGYLARPA